MVVLGFDGTIHDDGVAIKYADANHGVATDSKQKRSISVQQKVFVQINSL